MVEPTIDEAVLLYETARVLMDASPLVAADVYGAAGLPPGFPPGLADPPLPVVIAAPDGFAKLPDFWMRMDWVWKPVIELTVTIPVLAVARPEAAPVTTIIASFIQNGEILVIGGVVRAAGSGQPLPGAWVRLVELKQMVTTNAAGQFVFSGLKEGGYTLEGGAVGHPALARPITVPSSSGEYDLVLP
jgi:hypothetical protein